MVGNSVASLVALDLLRQNTNVDVTWIQEGLEPSGVWRGIQINGQTMDFGMVNFEIDLPSHSKGNLFENYNPFSINSCANFVNHVTEYLKSKVELIELPKIKILTDTGYVSDFLISNDLTDIIKYLQPNEEDINFESDRTLTHPSKKYEMHGHEDFGSSFDNYGKRMYFPSFHEKVLRRWGYRLLGNNYIDLQAVRHRSGWLPLYYPETLKDSLVGEVGLEPYAFHYPKNGSISKMWKDLATELNKGEGILKLNIMDFNKKEDLENYDQIIWGSSRQQFNRIFQPSAVEILNFKRVKIDLTYYETSDVDFEYCALNMQNNSDSWYRMTVSPNYFEASGKKLICIETKNDLVSNLAEVEKPTDQIKKADMKKLNEIKGIPVFSLPTEDEIKEIQCEITELIEDYKTITFVGPILMPFAQTMNDQIIQGVKASNE